MSGRESVLTVVAVDDRPVFARGLRSMFAECAGLRLGEIHESVRHLDGTDADVVLLELALRDGSSPRDNVTTLQEWGLPVLVYTGVYDVRLLAEAIDAGARGVVLKHQSEAELVGAIRQVHAGSTYLPQAVVRKLESGASARPRLSTREVEVLNLLYRGLITKQAARRLNVSESTVKEHLKRIRQKYSALGRSVSTRVQLLQVAERDGFIDLSRSPDEP